jgi:large subunit ribosomal protein L3
MAQFILGKKVGMTRIFDDAGKQVGVTVIQAGPCSVIQCKTVATDGYESVQLGFEDRKLSKLNSPMTGHFEKRGVAPKRYLKEFRVENGGAYQVGQQITVEAFKAGQLIDVIGVSKGKGFAGGMKRYGFKGGPATHGSKVHRAPQSSGATDAARVFKGTRKPGHMGDVQVTTQKLKVVAVDTTNNLLVVKGSVPGAPGGLLRIRGRE